jgi:hypothetical protein
MWSPPWPSFWPSAAELRSRRARSTPTASSSAPSPAASWRWARCAATRSPTARSARSRSPTRRSARSRSAPAPSLPRICSSRSTSPPARWAARCRCQVGTGCLPAQRFQLGPEARTAQRHLRRCHGDHRPRRKQRRRLPGLLRHQDQRAADRRWRALDQLDRAHARRTQRRCLAGNRPARPDHQQTDRQRRLQRVLRPRFDRRFDPLPRPRFRLSPAANSVIPKDP